MSTQNKPVLGYRECPDCGTRATVHQAAGRRHQLYQRCECGCVQSNGRLIQSRLWYETAWLADLKPSEPVGLMPLAEYQTELKKIIERNARSMPSTAGSDQSDDHSQADFDPVSDPVVSEVDDTADNEKSKSGVLWLFAGAASLLAVALRI